jgi:hypothetical protein
MSAKHTPGPWHRRIGRVGNGTPASQHEQVCNSDGVAVVMLEHDGQPDGDANARLIAAAPDLLEACKDALSSFSAAHAHRRNGNCECDVIRAAIAKAEGSR